MLQPSCKEGALAVTIRSFLCDRKFTVSCHGKNFFAETQAKVAYKYDPHKTGSLVQWNHALETPFEG